MPTNQVKPLPPIDDLVALVHELAFRLSLHGPGAAVQAMRMLEAAGVEPDRRLREAAGLPREGE